MCKNLSTTKKSRLAHVTRTLCYLIDLPSLIYFVENFDAKIHNDAFIFLKPFFLIYFEDLIVLVK
jgi:hypothetical protein